MKLDYSTEIWKKVMNISDEATKAMTAWEEETVRPNKIQNFLLLSYGL
jgi:hypothetical protein